MDFVLLNSQFNFLKSYEFGGKLSRITVDHVELKPYLHKYTIHYVNYLTDLMLYAIVQV